MFITKLPLLRDRPSLGSEMKPQLRTNGIILEWIFGRNRLWKRGTDSEPAWDRVHWQAFVNTVTNPCVICKQEVSLTSWVTDNFSRRILLCLILFIPSYCAVFCFFDRVILCVCWTGPPAGLLSISQVVRECMWSGGEMILTGETEGLWEKPATLQLCPPQIDHAWCRADSYVLCRRNSFKIQRSSSCSGNTYYCVRPEGRTRDEAKHTGNVTEPRF